MTTTKTGSMSVAGGRSLPLPLEAVTHAREPRRSSAPPFLQRTPEELAELDGARPAAKVAPERKQPRNPRPRTGARVRGRYTQATPTVATSTYPQRERIVDRMSAATKKRLAAEYEGGKSLAEVAAIGGVSADTIRTVLDEEKVAVRPRYQLRPRTILSPEQVTALVTAYKAGVGSRDLAQRYATGRDKVLDVLREHDVPIRGRGGPRTRRS